MRIMEKRTYITMLLVIACIVSGCANPGNSHQPTDNEHIEQAVPAAVDLVVPTAETTATIPMETRDPESTTTTIDGALCQHEWNDGVCKICQTVCAHERHDAETMRCALCGQLSFHDYVEGACRICGAVPSYKQDSFDREWFHPVVEQGTVHHHRVEDNVTEKIDAYDVYVYTPYGYDPDQQYNVLILLHGRGGSGAALLTDEHRFYGGMITGAQILDRMIAEHRIQPMIVCSFTYYLGAPSSWAITWLADSLLPWLAENYATYAEEATLEAISAQRQHFALGGTSFGANMVFSIGPDLLDCFGSYLLMASSAPGEPAMSAAYASGDERMPIHYAAYSYGTGDVPSETGLVSFQSLESAAGLVRGKTSFVYRPYGGHTHEVMWVAMYNAMPLLFQELGS